YDSVKLIVSPTQSPIAAGGRAATLNKPTAKITRAAVGPRVQGTGSWAIRLVAQANKLVDSHNYIGMTPRASAGEDFNKTPKPPFVAPYVSLAIARPDLQAGLYSQDLRSVGGTKTWNVVVSTDQANTDVVVSWPNIRTLPRDYRLTLTDKVSGQSV